VACQKGWWEMTTLFLLAILISLVIGFLPELLKIAIGFLIVAFVIVPIIRFFMDKYKR
jgi:hypothetical protein